MDGILLIDKNEGITSFKTIDKIKKKLGLKKIGHTGTLDPFATGLLISCVNNATKISSIFLGLDKVYETEIVFGEERETDDITSRVINKSSYIPTIGEIEKKIGDFIGQIEQIPPKYSAVKIKGQRAYKLARRGEDPILLPRKVTLYYVKIIDYKKPILKVIINCSSGFYVRSFARDIARSIGTYGYVSSLRRLKIGGFSVLDSKSIDNISNEDIINVEKATFFLEKISIDDKEYHFFLKNGYLNVDKVLNLPTGLYFRVYFKDEFQGIVNNKGSFIYRNVKRDC